jgi:hypothetical protein
MLAPTGVGGYFVNSPGLIQANLHAFEMSAPTDVGGYFDGLPNGTCGEPARGRISEGEAEKPIPRICYGKNGPPVREHQ